MTVYGLMDVRNPCYQADTCTRSPECAQSPLCAMVPLNVEELTETIRAAFAPILDRLAVLCDELTRLAPALVDELNQPSPGGDP